MQQFQSRQSVRRPAAGEGAYSTASKSRTNDGEEDDFFATLTAIEQKQEIMKRSDYTLPPEDSSDLLPPQASGHSEKLKVSHKELLLLYEDILYTLIHQTGVPSVTHITNQEEMIHYIQKVFKLDMCDHEAMMCTVKEAKAPSLTLKVTVMEARNLLAKDANGFSDPYCMLGITQGHATQEVEEKKGRKFSFRRKREKMEKRSSLKNVLPAKYIQVTDVKSNTLNPVWNESYVFEVDDIHSDQLHLDIWDHDDDVSVAEACKNLNQISGLKGMGRYFKQIMKSARANGSSGSQEENIDDFLGCLDIPVSEIPVEGIDTWYKLEPRSSSSRVEGDCHLILSLTMMQRDTELCKMMGPVMIHELLLRQLLTTELPKLKNDWSSFRGGLSKHAVTILSQHAMQIDLSPQQKASVEWLAYSKHHQLQSVDYGFLHQLLEDLDQKLDLNFLTQEQEESLSDSFVLFIDYCWMLLQRMRQVFPFNAPKTLKQLELMLRCLLKIYSMEAFKILCPVHKPLHVELVATVKKSTVEWYEKMRDSFKPETKSDQARLRALVQLVDTVCTDLRKKQKLYSKIFLSVVKIDYLSLTYQQLEKLVAEDVLTLMGELGAAMEQERSRMTQQIAETLFELYLSLKEVKQFKEFLPLKDSDLELGNFHDWFQISINKWLHIVYEKACERITKAVMVDQLDPVDALSKHSSSAVDVVTCFTQIKSFWLQLAWPDPMGAFVFVTKITDDICNTAVMYSEMIRQKADDQKKITQQLCIVLNNIEHVHKYIWNLPKELEWQEVETSVEQLCGLEGKQQVRRALDTQLQSIDAGMQRQSNYMINQLVEKMVIDLRKYIQHISLSPDSIQPDDAVSPLMKFLDDNLIILSECLVQENLCRILTTLWKLLLDLIAEALATNTGVSVEFYERFHFTLEALVLFLHAEGQGLPLHSLRNESYKALKEELHLNKCSTQQLIEKAYQAKIQQQKSLEPTPYGMLCIKCYYEAAEHKLYIEILHATNLIALDANGLSDPFVIIELAPQHIFPGAKSQRTQVKNKTLHPIFDEQFNFTVTEEMCSNNIACIHFTVMDHDWLSTNDFAGEAVLLLQEIHGFQKPAIAGGIKNVSPVFLKLTHPDLSVMKPIMKILEGRTGDKEAQDFVKIMKEMEVSPE
ncbi:BAI1-associated protein 3 isoform X2 [Pristis pectinata]|uniref:BAI1-associated protein 3 isoform X2 n=1 Tax=Pristis pectinata TaxID=685728 RepID=UPI00223DEB2C|nr:BAI1-associated protein 3 isoform X2 [Pristis pectinata]